MSSTGNEIFRNTVRKEFAFAKASASLAELWQRNIELPSGGCLVPLSHLHMADDNLVEVLARWRKAAAHAYPTRFAVTTEGTRRWMKDAVLAVEDRLLFLIYDAPGRLVGHCGYANALNDEAVLELDSVLRGESFARKGIMSEAVAAMQAWGSGTLFAEGIYLRVLESNPHAIRFYEELGYVERSRQPLRLVVHGSVEKLIPSEAGERVDDRFVWMDLAPKKAAPENIILTAGPSIGFREQVYAGDAVRHGWNNEWSKYLKAFEQSFASYVGVRYAMATSSCTGALHIALAALGIGPGDEVIVPDVTWVATANAVLYVGATPVFAEVDSATWCIDPVSAESLVTEKTKAIVPVHLYGHPADMDPIVSLAKRNDLFIVEDAAPSIGAEYKGRRTGSFGSFAAFSFQGAKLAVTGEGGMLVTDDEALYKRAYSIWDQGRTPGTFWIETNGLKYKMSNSQAAIGLGQLERNDEMVEAKRRIFGWYRENLSGHEAIEMYPEASWAKSIYSMTSIVVNEKTGVPRDDVMRRLREANVDTRPVFPAISQYQIWPTRGKPNPVASFVAARGINLPSGVRLTRSQVDYVSEELIRIIG